jgi:transposase
MNGRTRLAHKAEHAVDHDTSALGIHEATSGDPTTLTDTLTRAADHLEAVPPHGENPTKAIAKKGSHSNRPPTGFAAVEIRTYIAESYRGRRI